MIFTLEALEAKHGDSLLLHYDDRSRDEVEKNKDRMLRVVVIDGGPNGVWNGSLKKRLEELRAKRAHGGSLSLRMLMVSHIDDDHIRGILDLTGAVLNAEEAGADPPYDFPSLWHNSFGDLVKKAGLHPLSYAVSKVAAADVSGFPPTPWSGFLGAEASVIASSVPQGRRLRERAEALDCNLNPGFEDLVIATKGKSPGTPIGKQLRFRVIGPRQARLDDLRADWAKKLEELKEKKKTDPPGVARDVEVEAAAYIDKSIYNLSSIVVLAKLGELSMLLTGDARGDDILTGLEEAEELKSGKPVFNLLKVQHHGSENNSEQEFFERVTAARYVISADGKHGHPHPAMLRMLFAARKQDSYTVYLTNPVPHAVAELNAAQAANSGLEVVIRKDSEPSVIINLDEALPD